MISSTTPTLVLARYGAISEVARFRWSAQSELHRGMTVVVRTHRGEMLGTVLETIPASSGSPNPDEIEFEVTRVATEADLTAARQQQQQSAEEFGTWLGRIAKWNLELQLVDLEQTLDGSKRILYVLCERGPDSTKLALQAAAAGLGIVEVQPVNAEGLVQLPTSSGGGGCGSGEGGGCGCSH